MYPQYSTDVVKKVIAPLVSALLLAFQATPSIDGYCQTDFRDANFTAKVVSGDQDALRKIGKDFGTSYKFSSAQVFVQEPFKLRIESNYEGSKVVMVENALTTLYLLPGTSIKQRRDLTHAPGGRQTLLDFGILTPSLFSSLFDAAFVSEDPGSKVAVFDLTFKPSDDYKDKTRFRITVDGERRYVTRREWYGQDGALRATFEYGDPRQVSGIWVPTNMKVRNAEGKLAGETRAENLKINSGLDEKLFSVK